MKAYKPFRFLSKENPTFILSIIFMGKGKKIGRSCSYTLHYRLPGSAFNLRNYFRTY